MNLEMYGYAALGVAISIILPILRALLPKPKSEQTFTQQMQNTWKIIRPFIFVALFSLISGILIIANIKEEVDKEAAIIAGYAWDSTLQKMKGDS